LVKVYVEHPEDSQNGYRIIQLLREMRDPRALPALLKALKWQAEVNENHAIDAAQTLAMLELPSENKAEVARAVADALERIDGARPIDNRMRKAFIEALGAIGEKGTIETLIRIATAQSESQNFLFNRMAAMELARIGDPAAIQAMIKGLYLFAPNNPAMRMNDVAAGALVAIGRPAYQPVVDLLEGKNEEANAIAEQFIATIRERDPHGAAKMNKRQVVAFEATYTLGKLGFREALEPLLERTKDDDEGIRNAAAIALVSINRQASDTPRIVEAIKQTFARAEKISRPQMLVALQHLFAAESLPFLLEQAGTPELELPDIRILAYSGYAMLANKAETVALQKVLAKESAEGGFRPAFEKYKPAMDATDACDVDVSCWVGKLADTDGLVVRKAAHMLGRLARGNEKAIEGLVGHLGHRDLEVRYAVLGALDHIAVKGSAAAVAKIDQLQANEEGRSVWNNFKQEAVPTRHRLQTRMGPAS
jgi:HEAT repeat protein